MKNIKTQLTLLLVIAALAGCFGVVHSAFNPQINYQGKLTDDDSLAVADGNYNMRFKLCADSDCSSVLWTETRDCTNHDEPCTGTENRVAVTNGLFSVLLGSVTDVSGVDFAQTLYLEAAIGGTGATPAWETLTPRKKLGAVPAAFEAQKLGGYNWAVPGSMGLTTPNTGAFTTLSSIYSGASTALTANQSGSGWLADFQKSGASKFTIDNDGNIVTGSWNGSVILPQYGGTGVANNASSTIAISGNYGTTFTVSGTTALTLPTSGTLATLAGAESLTNKKLGSLTDNGFVKTINGDGTLSVDTGTYLTANQSITLSGDVTGTGTTSIAAIVAKINGVAYNADPLAQYALLAGRANGQTLIGGTAAGDALKLQGTAGNGTSASSSIEMLVGNNGGTTAMTILNSGSVGIGTTAPGAKLTVYGDYAAPTLGSELLANPNFDSNLTSWTAGANWAWNSGTAKHTAGSTAHLEQSISVESGAVYYVEYTTTGRTAGYNYLYFDGNYCGSATYDGNNKCSFMAHATESIVAEFTPDSNFDGAIDSISVKKVTATTDSVFKIASADGSDDIEFRNGSDNLYIGENSGYTNITGIENTAVGDEALSFSAVGNRNSAFGFYTLQVNSGFGNSAFGGYALSDNTIGQYNAAFGSSALSQNTTGEGNSGFGYGTLYGNTTGYSNSGFGMTAMYSNITGNYNSVSGNNALYYNETGSYNTAFGAYAGFGVSDNSFSNNSLFGYSAGSGLSTGSNNLLLGYKAGNNLTTGSNNIVIGYDIDAASSTAANTLNIGNLIFATGVDGTGTTLSTGKVGIGTTAPQSLLDIQGAAGATGGVLTVATRELTVVDNDVLGRINFNAPLESDGSDSILLGASIAAIAEGTFGATSNATELAFFTGASEAATQKMVITSAGNVGIGATAPGAKLAVYGDYAAPTLGSELLANPNFDSNLTSWTAGANWAWNSGTAKHTAGASASLEQSISVESGAVYYIDYVIVEGTAGYNDLYIDGVYYCDAASTGYCSFKADATESIVIEFAPTTDFDGAIDSVSVKKVTATSGSVFKIASANGTNAIDFRNGSGNLYIGENSGYKDIEGLFNVSVGVNTLSYNVTGQSNSAFGYHTLEKNDSSGNSGFGSFALEENITGFGNSAFGYQTLSSNTTGYGNSALGVSALASNETGGHNVVAGFQAAFYNETGSYNSIFGADAGTGVSNNSYSNNSLFGYSAGYGLSTGSNNLLFGYHAGDNLTTGSNNIVIGYDIDAPAAASANTLNIGNLIFATGVDGTGTTLSTGNVGIGVTAPAGRFVVAPPATEIIAAGATITADGCGTVKRITSSADRTTNTTNTFTAPAAGNAGCVMTVVNVGAYTITLDRNTNFKTTATANVALGPLDSLIVVSDGTYWYQAAGAITNSDLAEWYLFDGPRPEPGDLVSISNTGMKVEKSSQPYDRRISGIVSTQPAMVLGQESGQAIAMALAGRVPLKVFVKDGQINTGDEITSSAIPGVGMKASRAGQIAGKALESTAGWNDSSCTAITSLESIVWPEDDGTNPSKPCFKIPDPTNPAEHIYVGKIMVFMNVSWHDPNAGLAADFLAGLNGGALDGSLAVNDDGTLSATTTSGFIENHPGFMEVIRAGLAKLGLAIKDGVASLAELIVDKFTAKTARVEQLEMVDKADGKIYCTWVENGVWQKTEGACAAGSAPAAGRKNNSGAPAAENSGGGQAAVPSPAGIQTQPETLPEIKTEIETETKTEAEADVETEIEVKTESEIEVKTESEISPQPEAAAAPAPGDPANDTAADIEQSAPPLDSGTGPEAGATVSEILATPAPPPAQ